MSYSHIVSQIHDPILAADPVAQGFIPLIEETGKRIGWVDSRNEKLMSIFKRHSGYGVEIEASPQAILIQHPNALAAFTAAARHTGNWPQNVSEDIPVWLRQAIGKPDSTVNRMDIYPLGVMARGVHLICKDEDGNYLLSRRSDKVAVFKKALDVSVGGFVGAGMTPATALQNESLEEIGLDSTYIQAVLDLEKPRTYEYINRKSGFPVETNGGVWHDRVYAWTLSLPNDFKSEFNDGEVRELLRVTPKELIEALKVPAAVKVNSAMMLLDDLYQSGHFAKNKEARKYVENFVHPLCRACDF